MKPQFLWAVLDRDGKTIVAAPTQLAAKHLAVKLKYLRTHPVANAWKQMQIIHDVTCVKIKVEVV